MTHILRIDEMANIPGVKENVERFMDAGIDRKPETDEELSSAIACAMLCCKYWFEEDFDSTTMSVWRKTNNNEPMGIDDTDDAVHFVEKSKWFIEFGRKPYENAENKLKEKGVRIGSEPWKYGKKEKTIMPALYIWGTQHMGGGEYIKEYDYDMYNGELRNTIDYLFDNMSSFEAYVREDFLSEKYRRFATHNKWMFFDPDSRVDSVRELANRYKLPSEDIEGNPVDYMKIKWRESYGTNIHVCTESGEIATGWRNILDNKVRI